MPDRARRRARGESRRSTSCATSSATPSTVASATSAVATTRFREYFPPEITNDPTLVTHAGAEVRARRAVVAPAGPARRALRRPDVDVGRTRRPRPVVRDGCRDDYRRRSPEHAPAAGCASYLDRPGTRPAPTSCSASCSRTSPGSRGRSTLRLDHGAATAKALADELAERAITKGWSKPEGPATASPAKRLLAAIRSREAGCASAPHGSTRWRHRGGARGARRGRGGAWRGGRPRREARAPQQAQLDAILASCSHRPATRRSTSHTGAPIRSGGRNRWPRARTSTSSRCGWRSARASRSSRRPATTSR